MSRPEVIAHRGGLWDDTAENTLESFRRSAERGIDWIETDVHASRDGVLYAVHDADLRRLAGRNVRIRDLPAAALDGIELISGGCLPRLSSVLEELPSTQFNIDVKADRSAAATIRLVRRMKIGERVRLASFSTPRLRRLRAALPGVRTSAGTSEVAFFLRRGAGAAARFDPSLDCFQVPVRRGPVLVVTPRFLRHARAAGLEVHVWTVNDPTIMLTLTELGVDGLVTDYPQLCLDTLAGPRE